MAIELGDLAGVYREAPALLRGRRSRVVFWTAVVLGLAYVVGAIVSGEAWRLASAVPYLLLAAVGIAQDRRPRQTRLAADAVVVRTSVMTQRRVGWEDVASIRVQGRWDLHSGAVLRHGPELPLPGLPAREAARLAVVVGGGRPRAGSADEAAAARIRSRATAPAPPTAGRRPPAPDDLDMEAGFRRGSPRS